MSSVLRAFKALEEELLDALEFVDVVLSWTAWGLNALYEAALDKPAPGATNQAVKGHDHLSVASSGQGGRIVGRNMCAMGGAGVRGFGEVEITALNVNTWVGLPTNYINAGLYSFRAWISDDMISPAGNAPDQPHLDAYVYVYSAIQVDIRIVHGSTAFASAVATFTPNAPFLSGLVRIERIPANGAGWNPYYLQVRSADQDWIYVGFLNHSESPIVNDTYVAGQPPAQSQQLGG